jgi:hypothetical protein
MTFKDTTQQKSIDAEQAEIQELCEILTSIVRKQNPLTIDHLLELVNALNNLVRSLYIWNQSTVERIKFLEKENKRLRKNQLKLKRKNRSKGKPYSMPSTAINNPSA